MFSLEIILALKESCFSKILSSANNCSFSSKELESLTGTLSPHLFLFIKSSAPVFSETILGHPAAAASVTTRPKPSSILGITFT